MSGIPQGLEERGIEASSRPLSYQLRCSLESAHRPLRFPAYGSESQRKNSHRINAPTSNPQRQLAIGRVAGFSRLYSYPRQRGGGIAIELGKSSYLRWNVQPLATINEPPGLGVELDFKRLTQIAEITEPVTARAQTYFRPDGSITNW